MEQPGSDFISDRWSAVVKFNSQPECTKCESVQLKLAPSKLGNRTTRIFHQVSSQPDNHEENPSDTSPNFCSH